MSIKKLKSPKTRGINVSGEREELLKINEIIDNLNNSSTNGRECVIFLNSQSGTDAPDATIIINNLGVTPTITRDDVGNYFVNAAGVFTEGRTICEADNKSADTFGKITIQRSSDDLVTFQTYDLSGTQSDDMLLNNWIKITVY